jgi:hypothetical protein
MDANFYNSPEWRALRRRVIARDGGVCTVSRLLGGACAGTLHVHHIQPRETHPELELDEDNLATVCAGHHPRWEAIRRTIERMRDPMQAVGPCRHSHRYKHAAEECRRKRAREAGLLDPVQLTVA